MRPRRSCARTASKVSAKRRSTVSVSSSRSARSSSSARSRSSRCVRSSERRSFSAAYSSFANGLTPPSCSRRRSSRSSFSASSSRGPSAGSAPAASSRRCASARSASKRATSTSTAATRSAASECAAPELDLPAAERAQLGCQLGGTDCSAIGLREHRRLEPLDRPEHRRDRLHERRPRGDERRVGQPRHGPRGLGPQRRRLVQQPPALCLQLEQDGLGRVAREREHAARRVVVVPLERDRRAGRGEQSARAARRRSRRAARSCPAGRARSGCPRPRSRACSSRRSPSSGRRGDERGADGGGDRALAALLDLGQRQRERRALPRRALGRRAAAPSRSAIARSSAAPPGPRRCAHARPARRRSPAAASRTPREQRLRRLAAELEPLAGAAQPVERGGRALASAGRLGQRLLRPAALGEQPFERFLGRAPLGGEAGAARSAPWIWVPQRQRRRASRSLRAGRRSRRRASRRARRPSPAAPAAGAASPPRPRRPGPLDLRRPRARASARRDGGGA